MMFAAPAFSPYPRPFYRRYGKYRNSYATKRKVRGKVRRMTNCGKGGLYVGNGVGCIKSQKDFIEQLLAQTRLKGRGTKTEENGTVEATWKIPASMQMTEQSETGESKQVSVAEYVKSLSAARM